VNDAHVLLQARLEGATLVRVGGYPQPAGTYLAFRPTAGDGWEQAWITRLRGLDAWRPYQRKLPPSVISIAHVIAEAAKTALGGRR
jgi:hypothetical protein